LRRATPFATRSFYHPATDLADESFAVIVVENACAAGSDELHRHELEAINMIYCHVMSGDELLGYLP
jgi:nicotinamidase-related amidase